MARARGRRRTALLGLALATLALGAAGSARGADTPGHPRGVGFCREVTCPCRQDQLDRGMVDTPQGCQNRCDPKLAEDFARKERASRELFEFSQELNRRADDLVGEFFESQLPVSGDPRDWGLPRDAAASAGIDVWTAPAAESAAQAAERAARLTKEGVHWHIGRASGSLLEAEKAARAAEAAARSGNRAVWAGRLSTASTIATLADFLYRLGETVRQMRTWWAEAAEAAARSEDLWQKALADFEADLKQATACLEQLERVKARERLREEAEAMIEEWRLPGGHLYRDPSGQVYDARAALDRAMALLSAPPGRGGALEPAIRLAAAGGAPPPEAMPTSRQLAEARAEVERAAAAVARAMDQVIEGLRAQGALERRLDALITRF